MTLVGQTYNTMSAALNSPTSLSLYLDHCANPHATLDIGNFTGGRLLISYTGDRRCDAPWGDGFRSSFFFNQQDGDVLFNVSRTPGLAYGDSMDNVTFVDWYMETGVWGPVSVPFSTNITLDIPEDSSKQVSMRFTGWRWGGGIFNWVQPTSSVNDYFSYCYFGNHGQNWLDINDISIRHTSSSVDRSPTTTSPTSAPTAAPTAAPTVTGAFRHAFFCGCWLAAVREGERHVAW